jgi:hypothetical protein
VNPPPGWSYHPGTCRLVVREGGLDRLNQPIACSGAQSITLFDGDGATYTARAQFCDPACGVESNVVAFDTVPTEQIWCGDPPQRC